jgi:quinol monooxygenase YgiN
MLFLYDTGSVKQPEPRAFRCSTPAGARVTDDPGVEIWMVTGRFQARTGRAAELGAALARYVVLTRDAAGCRNVDLVLSAGDDTRYLVVEKWDDPNAQRAHLDAEITVAMATTVAPLLASPPELELHQAISAYDLD